MEIFKALRASYSKDWKAQPLLILLRQVLDLEQHLNSLPQIDKQFKANNNLFLLIEASFKERFHNQMFKVKDPNLSNNHNSTAEKYQTFNNS